MIPIRAFIGIDFSVELKDDIAGIQKKLKQHTSKGRWKHSENLHLTLKFLGEVSPSQQSQIDALMKEVCLTKTSFNLAMTGLDAFDWKDTVRVLFLGIAGDIWKLKSLQEDIDKALIPLGFQPEKRGFAPHVTIGQDLVFDCDFKQIQDELGEIKLGPIIVNSLFLYKSEQVQDKRIYTRISEYSLPSVL